MRIFTYRAMLKHDTGYSYLTVTGTCYQSAIDIICAAEHCPETAIQGIKVIKEVKVK